MGSRAVVAYLKVVRGRKQSSAEGTRGGRPQEGDYSLSRNESLVRGVWGAPPRILSASMCFFNGGFVRLKP